jgi:hypothetical protein
VAQADSRHTGLTDFLQEILRLACLIARWFIWRDFRFLYLSCSQICHPRAPDNLDPFALHQIIDESTSELTFADALRKQLYRSPLLPDCSGATSLNIAGQPYYLCLYDLLGTHKLQLHRSWLAVTPDT